MHTAVQLYGNDFDVVIDGEHVGTDGLLPGWSALDRFGIVVDSTLGVLGASLLTQAAIACHFDVRPERRGPRPAYPEIFAFHVGEPQGDHNYYDFWPSRKEIVVPAGSPSTLLAEINAHGITRLAVPGVAPVDVSVLEHAESAWAEQYSARDRITSCFAYSPCGTVAEADVTISTTAARAEENNYNTLHAMEVARAAVARDGIERYTAESKPDLPADILKNFAEDTRRWAATVEARVHEVTAIELRILRQEHIAKTARAGGIPSERYRRLRIDEAFAVLASYA